MLMIIPMAEQNRVHPRLSVSVPIEYLEFERFQQDRILNLSARGIFILSPKPFSVGRIFCIRFEVPDLPGSVFRARGRVVWNTNQSRKKVGARHPNGMGIRFDEDAQKIARIIDQYVTVKIGLKSLDKRIGTELPKRHYQILEPTDPTPIEFDLKTLDL